MEKMIKWIFFQLNKSHKNPQLQSTGYMKMYMQKNATHENSETAFNVSQNIGIFNKTI